MCSDMLPQGVKLIQLPQFVDERGKLSFLEESVHIPFLVRRVFWIVDVPEGQTRGGHAHWSCHEAVFLVSGGFEMLVDDGKVRRKVMMNTVSQGILIPAGIWCELSHFSPGTVCVAVASMEYDATGYCNNYEQFLQECIQHDKLAL